MEGEVEQTESDLIWCKVLDCRAYGATVYEMAILLYNLSVFADLW
jgi:hypothetical protein